jgi:hypothetical protein
MDMQHFTSSSNRALTSLRGMKGVYTPEGSEAKRDELANAVITWVIPAVIVLFGRAAVWYWSKYIA